MTALRPLLAALAVAGLAALGAALAEPAWVERVYTRGLYPAVAGAIGAATAPVPFSLTELLQAGGLLGGLAFLGLAARRPRAWLWLTVAAALAYPLFLGVWGLNYRRVPLADTLGLELRPAHARELRALVDEAVATVNAEWVPLEPDPGVLTRAADVYRANPAPWRPAPPVPVKPLLASPLYTRMNLLGFFFPFTGEPHVNAETPPPMLAWAALHELAHQQGFAQEDEASFVAVVVGREAAEPAFRYSTAFYVVIQAIGAMGRDGAGQAAAWDALAPAVQADAEAWGRFLGRRSPTLARAADAVNDAYLRSQGVPDGTRSYGRVVDLLLAERRRRE